MNPNWGRCKEIDTHPDTVHHKPEKDKENEKKSKENKTSHEGEPKKINT